MVHGGWSRDRVRVLVAALLTLLLTVPLATMWWRSLLPASYAVTEMGTPDYGGGPALAMGHGHEGQAPADPVSVVDLDTPPGGDPDVEVDLVARQGRYELASGRTVDGFSLNGTSPGPLIEATVGDLVEVRVRNESVRDGLTLHWHGVDVPNAQDGVAGVTQDAIEVGEDFTYRWVAPDAGTYWYHAHQMSHEQVSGGLLGGIVVHPATREAGIRDVLTLAHVYDGKPTVDGLGLERRVVAEPGERMRLRVVNTDNGSQRLWSPSPFVLRAVDGIDVNRPDEVTGRAVGIPAGGRVDVEVRVPDQGAVRVQLLEASVVIGPEGATADRVEPPEHDLDLLHHGVPADLGFDPEAADRRFEYSVGKRPGFINGRPGLWWSVNGKLYQDMPMFVIAEGDVVRVRISNHSGEVHPMHLHGHHAVVLSRDGKRATGSPWWFDSLDVPDGSTFEVAFVADNPGIWMDHCHNLQHAAEGLVTHLMYAGVSTPYRIGEDSGNTPE